MSRSIKSGKTGDSAQRPQRKRETRHQPVKTFRHANELRNLLPRQNRFLTPLHKLTDEAMRLIRLSKPTLKSRFNPRSRLSFGKKFPPVVKILIGRRSLEQLIIMKPNIFPNLIEMRPQGRRFAETKRFSQKRQLHRISRERMRLLLFPNLNPMLKRAQKPIRFLKKPSLFSIHQFVSRSEEHTSELQSRGHLVC